MTELSQPETGIWRERLWFVARLFAAWAVIGLAFQLIQILGRPFTVQLEISDQWSPWQQTAFLYFGYGFVYFFGGFFAISFFREPWLRVCVGIVLVVTILSLFSGGILIASQWIRSFSPEFIGPDPWFVEYYGWAIINSVVIVGPFLVAGGTLRHIIAPPDAAGLSKSMLSQFVLLLSIYAAATRFGSYASSIFNDIFGFLQLLSGLGDYFPNLVWSLLYALSAMLVLYLFANRFGGDKIGIAKSVLAAGLTYLVVREGLNTIITPIVNDIITGTSPTVTSVFPRLPTDQSAFQAWSGTAWIYAVNNSFPALLRDFLITLIAVSGIVLRQHLPPRNIPPLARRFGAFVLSLRKVHPTRPHP